MPDPDVLLQADAIDVDYGAQPLIRGLSLGLSAGSFTGLIGANGAGKTTLLLALSGQFRPARGVIRYRGADVYADNLAYKQRIGFAHEQPFFYPYLTAEEFLHFVARVKGGTYPDIEARVAVLLKAVRLVDERDKPTAHLSTGMRKKLSIAAALLGDPEILFLDEALNGVDVESAFHIKAALQEFVSRGGAVVLSTHVLEVIEKYCDRYLVLRDGALVADLSAAQFRAGTGAGAGVGEQPDLEQYVIRLLGGVVDSGA